MYTNQFHKTNIFLISETLSRHRRKTRERGTERGREGQKGRKTDVEERETDVERNVEMKEM